MINISLDKMKRKKSWLYAGKPGTTSYIQYAMTASPFFMNRPATMLMIPMKRQ